MVSFLSLQHWRNVKEVNLLMGKRSDIRLCKNLQVVQLNFLHLQQIALVVDFPELKRGLPSVFDLEP
jgi:hypothetical protein